MRRPVIAIPIETKNREWKGKMLLCYELIRRDFEVIIGSSQEIYYNLHKLRPDLFLINSGDSTPYINSSLTNYKDAGGYIALLENEGGVFSDWEIQKRRFNPKTVSLVDKYFPWSENTANLAIKEGLFSANNVEVTGHPTFDLLKKPFTNVYQKLSDSIKLKYPNLILINTNFGAVNEAVKGQYDGLFTDEFKSFIQNMLNSFVELIRKLSIRYPKFNFVLRPHPSESENIYNKAFEGLSNISISKEGAVHAWLLASKFLIHNGCTTGVEGVLCDANVISYRPHKDLRFDNILPNLCGIECNNVEEIQNLLDNIELSSTNSYTPVSLGENKNDLAIENKSLTDEQLSNVTFHLNNFKDAAYLKIADSIGKFNFAREMKEIRNDNNLGIIHRIKPYFYDTFIEKLLPSKYKIEARYQKGKFPITHIQEVVDEMNNFKECLGDHTLKINVTKERFYRRVFRIKKAN